MEVDAEKLRQAVLALLHLNTFEQKAEKRNHDCHQRYKTSRARVGVVRDSRGIQNNSRRSEHPCLEWERQSINHSVAIGFRSSSVSGLRSGLMETGHCWLWPEYFPRESQSGSPYR